MIDAGLPLVQCLEILSTQSENKSLASTLLDEYLEKYVDEETNKELKGHVLNLKGEILEYEGSSYQANIKYESSIELGNSKAMFNKYKSFRCFI